MPTPDAQAWAIAEDAAERERLRRLRGVSLLERLRSLEEQSRFLATIRAHHLARDAQKKSQ